ncbi:NACHT domain-containing protein [Leptothoe spongobia]|uniref:NACHT domain-containing protein n=1 Tax=Leptothoe spongobia TAU-MAC 1115 TaxID=1967444 RepID=A0A947DFI0_9CYAN|nr:hypothetical protein [Leptothoe spongobia]MBT9316088.1 hypothetical protein [Leptothoe spongobia TAU-MAC 1115]
MPSLDWAKFNKLTGSKSCNFEILCRNLMRLHFGRFGHFKALKNQPGVEFHIEFSNGSPLSTSSSWFGWQCKWHKLTQKGDLTATSRRDIKESLRTTENVLPDLTDWILWTPYTLSKKDQDWYYTLKTKFKLQLWSKGELETYLSGDGLSLRSTYFGELILTPHNLTELHTIAIQPIRERWIEPVHQSVDAERQIRRMLGEVGSWEQLIELGKQLKNAADLISNEQRDAVSRLKPYISSFVNACAEFADTLIHFREILASGDLEIIQQKLTERKALIDLEVRSTPRHLRSANHSAALYATNALDDMFIAQELLDEAEEFLGVGLVAILADAGGGKTQMAAQLTVPQENRPAGIFLHGRNLHKGQSLDDLARKIVINGFPAPSMEGLLAAVDAVAKRACCRLPVLIDGLNEAENPKDWKPELASLSELVKRFPNVLVVCTLRTGERKREKNIGQQESYTETRESFAHIALPHGIRKIESEGFGSNTEEAIKKYFRYYKITSGDAVIPEGFLQHPLTLRIFCEVTNPKRESEVKVDHFLTSLSPLFEKYIANAAERISQMTNLSYSYRENEVHNAIYKLGLELWKCRKRDINEADFCRIVSDDSRQWDSRIVNLLAQEGILFKNPSVADTYVITPTYDALGGYIVANALLQKHAQDTSFTWLNNSSELFDGDTSHELAFDIFRSLVTLAPRRTKGKQIWKEISGSLKKRAIIWATEIDVEFLDKDTIAALINLLNESPENRHVLFSRLQAPRAIEHHPLNANFLDATFREMSVSKRDILWDEWIRTTRIKRLEDLLLKEEKWKQNLDQRTTVDHLQAKWFMWFLTSTDRELRDLTTRTLYWFGRGDPKTFFAQCLESLEINDPYVPERMLAASYGVAMAKHVDFNDQVFTTEVLPAFARNIYTSIFIEDAAFSTTHSLIREYARRIIEMAYFHVPNLFSSEELQRSQPPYSGGDLSNWGESESSYGMVARSESPFRMDFENYTLGSLVSGRMNYDFKHDEYAKIRAKILWRIEQLGWSSEKFKNIEDSIENQNRWLSSRNDFKKTERYGKKYSWIGFFEMSGLLHDLGKIDKSAERDWTWTLDIDPSFPEPVSETSIIQTDFLGRPDIKTKEWILNGPLPDIQPYLQLEEINNEVGPWIMLDGYISQENKKLGRSIFCFIRSFLVLSDEADSFIQHLSKQNLGGRWLPEKPSAESTFSGEISWSEAFCGEGLSKFSFDVEEDNEPHVITYSALIPVCDFRWASERSAANNNVYGATLAKELIHTLELIDQPQTLDLFTNQSEKITYNLASGQDDLRNSQHLFYMKEQLLRDFLEANQLALIWAVWGERECSYDKINDFLDNPSNSNPAYKVYSFVKLYT